MMRLHVGGLILFLSLCSWAQDYVPGELIVKLKGKPNSAGAAKFYGKVSAKISLKGQFSGINMHHFALKPGADLQASLEELRQDPDVEYAEPNYILKIADVIKDDNQVMSMAEAQALVTASSAATYTQSYAPVKVTESWSNITASSLITPVVAVIDTGVDYNHTLFTSTGAIWSNPGETGTDSHGLNKATNGIDDDGNGYVDDYRGWNFYANTNSPLDDDEHGTHVAGIILGVGQDVFASPLTAAKIRIMPLKFLAANGSGSTTDAINAIYYAVRNGANVINNSWGGSSYSQALHDAFAYAYTNRVTIVAAAGNYTSNNDTTAMYPANLPVPSLISVAATNDYDNLASFSNYGKSYVHVAAPGVAILSSVPGNSFRYMSGTSMASPFVAGMAAMMFREAPSLSGYQIKNLMLSTVNLVSSLSTKVVSGGRVNENSAITSAKANSSVASSQPVYVASAPSGSRDLASTSDSEPKGGCGLVTTALTGAAGAGTGGGPGAAALIVIVLAMPMIVLLVLRSRKVGREKRRYERFQMNSDIKLNVGGRELQGQMRTISEGGLSFCANSMLEKGGIVTMKISSPDGTEQIEVQGHVVWSESNQAYGVQFDEAKEGVVASIRNWSARLIRAN